MRGRSGLAPLKRDYGSPLSRLLRGGTVLSEGEHQLIAAMVENLPPTLRAVAECQLGEYNLVQREADGRALNFYRLRGYLGKPIAPSRLFAMQGEEYHLIRITAKVSDHPPIHATLTAVSGRLFCAAFSSPVPEVLGEGWEITKVVPSWKGAF